MAARAGELIAEPGEREYCEVMLMALSVDFNPPPGMATDVLSGCSGIFSGTLSLKLLLVWGCKFSCGERIGVFAEGRRM